MAAAAPTAVYEPESDAMEADVCHKASAGPQKGKEMRSAALREWAKLLERFPEDLDFSAFWAARFCAVEPLIREADRGGGQGFFVAP